MSEFVATPEVYTTAPVAVVEAPTVTRTNFAMDALFPADFKPKGKPRGKKRAEYDKAGLQTAINAIEASGPLAKLADLWTAVVAHEWNTRNVKPWNASKVMLMVKRDGLTYKTRAARGPGASNASDKAEVAVKTPRIPKNMGKKITEATAELLRAKYATFGDAAKLDLLLARARKGREGALRSLRFLEDFTSASPVEETQASPETVTE